jgi:mono/diheme cytochrome c family protein
MKSIPLVSALFGISLISFSAWADVDVLLQRGEEIYTQPASCGTCHGLQGEGGVGPTLSHGPTPYDVDEQF